MTPKGVMLFGTTPFVMRIRYVDFDLKLKAIKDVKHLIDARNGFDIKTWHKSIAKRNRGE